MKNIRLSRMTRRSILSNQRVGSPALRFLTILWLTLSGAALTANAQGNLCSEKTPKYPCLNQPNEGDTSVKGELVKAGGTVPAASDVKISIDGFMPSAQPTITGTSFTFQLAGALGPDNSVTVTITGEGNTGAVKVIAKNPKSTGLRVVLIGGWEQAGYSSLTDTGNPFVHAFLESSGDKFSVWGRVRLLSAPQPSTQGIFTVITNPTGQLTTSSFSKTGQSLDFVLGPRVTIPGWPGSHGISFIADVGATTPLSSQDVAVTYKAPAPGTNECTVLASRFSSAMGYNPGLVQAPPGSTTCLAGGYTDVAFANQDRSNFLLKYGGGFRAARSIDCTSSGTDKTQCSPSYAAIDVTFGQDESVTGGKLHAEVFKLDGVLPIQTGGSAWLYIFGSVYLRTSPNRNLAPLILTPDTGVTIPSPTAFVLPLRQPDRDYFRLGVGINLAQIFCKISANACANNESTKSDTKGSPKKSNAKADPII